MQSITGENELSSQYAYYRLSTCDPNMCSTAARLSPTNLNINHNQSGSINDSYENIILVPCNQEESQHLNTNAILTDYGNYQTVTDSHQSYNYERPFVEDEENHHSSTHQNNLLSNHQTPAQNIEIHSGNDLHKIMNYNQEIFQGNDVQYVTDLSQTNQIMLNQEQQQYQNFYINNGINENGNVGMTQIGNNMSNENHQFVHREERNDEFSISHSSELLNNFCEPNFIPLEASIINQQELVDNYSSLSEKDHQRMLLESTMSPLLAAVNNITQRDAELQSYLNQTRTESGIDNFQIDQTKSKFEGTYNNNERTEYFDINDVTKPRKSNLRKKTSTIERDELQENDNCLLISDKPVETRARASLPTNYLYFGKNKDKTEVIFSKKKIPCRTKFGPFEGEVYFLNESTMHSIQTQTDRIYPVLLLGNNEILEVSNENTSNWMRFVRMAKTINEQNLELFEDDGRLYFRSCRTINPREELCVSYSEEYSQKYSLPYLTPVDGDQKELYNDNDQWSCFECDQIFQTSDDLQIHLNMHDQIEMKQIEEGKKTKKKKVRRKMKKTHDGVKRLPGVQKNSNRCYYCPKVFMTTASLKKHTATHLAEKRLTKSKSKNLICEDSTGQIKCCYKKFSSEEKLRKHRLVHLKDESKVYKCPQCNKSCATPTALSSHLKSHNDNKQFHCVYCSESFKHMIDLRSHVVKHSVNGMYPCHLCGKEYFEYQFARKHIRLFHPGVTYSCDICGRQFVHINTLRRHMSCHSEKRDFLCSQCGNQFKRKDQLKTHIRMVHSEKEKRQVVKNKSVDLKKKTSSKAQMKSNSKKKDIKLTQSDPNPVDDYQRFFYKCHECMFGFKRRGMLINHMAKRHPEIQIESIPELNHPILKTQMLFFCPYCSKIYKNNSKRKIHILKSHPGQELPPSVKNNPIPQLLNVQMVGSIKTDPQQCQWCYKQYVTRNKLLCHYRKEHSAEEAAEKHKNYNKIDQEDIIQNKHLAEQLYNPQNSPENKLLKLSSAALELSSIEDPEFFDFLNVRSQEPLSHSIGTSTNSLDDNPSSYSEVDVNFKTVESEFGDNSSSDELNKLPLFEESITCI